MMCALCAGMNGAEHLHAGADMRHFSCGRSQFICYLHRLHISCFICDAAEFACLTSP